MNYVLLNKKMVCLFLVSVCLFFLTDIVYSQETADSQNDKTVTETRIVHVARKEISAGEKGLYLGMVYCAQWSYYVIGQNSNIRENGSFENWYTNMPKVQFDKDSYDYNLILHTMTGNYYYLFYRSRGYSKPSALTWSFLSHLLFEFTVETVTEPPSIQDIYQTPVLGSLVGMLSEAASLCLLNSEYRALRFLGYVLNPFTLFGFSYYEVRPVTAISTGSVTYGFAVNF